MPKIFGLDSSTVRQITKLFALDGATPRRVKKLFSNDGGTIRLIFEDKSTFTVSGTANLIQSPVNEVIEFGFRTDFDAGGTDTTVNTSGSGDASNVGTPGLTIDVDSSHTYSGNSPLKSPGGAPMAQGPSPGFSQPPSNAVFIPNDPQLGVDPPVNQSMAQEFASVLGPNANSNWGSGSYLTINGVQTTGSATSWGGGAHREFGSGVYLYYFGGQYGARVQSPPGNSLGPMRVSGVASVTTTGRRARVQNGTGKTFTIQSGGLTAGGNFATGDLANGAATGFITANSTSEAWTLVGLISQDPATFSISNADGTISVSGTFADGENATQARTRIKNALNGNSTFTGKFDTGTDSDKTISGVSHKIVTFTSDSAENTSDFTITITQNDGSNTTGHEAVTTQGAAESLQTVVTVVREVEGSSVSTATAISSEASTDTAGAAVASNTTQEVTYDSSTNKLRVNDQEATVNVTNPGSLSFSKD
tara:strand:- start:1099 stop:2532 length:1434 start_codon:yes stop_codon:yes gene_type:complete